MTEIKTKRVYYPWQPQDGCRVLVDKLWPRGMRKEDLRYDIWAKDIAPSTPLRKWFHEQEAGRWEEFSTKYRSELEHSPAAEEFVGEIEKEKTVTLLYASRNTARNHALLLRDFLARRLRR